MTVRDTARGRLLQTVAITARPGGKTGKSSTNGGVSIEELEPSMIECEATRSVKPPARLSVGSEKGAFRRRISVRKPVALYRKHRIVRLFVIHGTRIIRIYGLTQGFSI